MDVPKHNDPYVSVSEFGAKRRLRRRTWELGVGVVR